MIYLLFCVHIMLFVVVILVLVLIVELFVFLSIQLLLCQLGLLALLYHESTHYPSHGGASGSGVACGAFSVAADGSFSGTYWDYGAALLFFFILYSSWWLFRSWYLLWGILCSCQLYCFWYCLDRRRCSII